MRRPDKWFSKTSAPKLLQKLVQKKAISRISGKWTPILTAKDFFKGFRRAERLPRLRPEVGPALSAGG